MNIPNNINSLEAMNEKVINEEIPTANEAVATGAENANANAESAVSL